jgi:hypothetical protein
MTATEEDIERVVAVLPSGATYLVDGVEVTPQQYAAAQVAAAERAEQAAAASIAEAEAERVTRKETIRAALGRVNTGKASPADVEFLAGVLA